MDLEPYRVYEVFDPIFPDELDSERNDWIDEVFRIGSTQSSKSGFSTSETSTQIYMPRAEFDVDDIESTYFRNGHFKFSLSNTNITSVTIVIFSTNGKKLLIHQGTQKIVEFNVFDKKGRQLSNGVYFYQITLTNAKGNIIKGPIRKFHILR